jgi:hypothetical protein
VTSEQTALVMARMSQQHRYEIAKLEALVIRYREFIEDHGLTAPDDSGAEALRRFRVVFEIAGLWDPLQHPELLADWTKEKVA